MRYHPNKIDKIFEALYYRILTSCSNNTSRSKWLGSGSFTAFLVLSVLSCPRTVAEHCNWSDLGWLWMFSIHSLSLLSVTKRSGVSPRQFFIDKFAFAWMSLLMQWPWLCLAARCSGVSLYDVPCVKHIVTASTFAPYLLKKKKCEPRTNNTAINVYQATPHSHTSQYFFPQDFLLEQGTYISSRV